MHAAFPRCSQELQHVLHLGADAAKLPEFEAAGGKLLSHGIAALFRLGFGFVLRDSLLDKRRAEKARAFFEENFLFVDPNAPGGRRYYQGKFLLRTRKPGDDLNVLLRFCPNPRKLYKRTVFGEALNPAAVVVTEVLSERDADKAEKDPQQVDLVIRFKDINSIVALVGRPDVDLVGLLLENVVQLTGNVGHLFKLAAIGKNIELALDLPGLRGALDA